MILKMPKSLLLLIVLLISCYRSMHAQSFFIPEVPHPRNKVIRNAIDEEKPALGNISDDALNLAREFKRRDSTYYVPWMIEGIYYKERAADKLGFDNASKFLAKAFALITADYSASLKKRTSDFFEYFPIYNLHLDFSYIANHLVECYSYIDKADSAFKIAETYGKYNLQFEGAFNNYDSKAWIVHRNRFYDSQKYYFLKNSIEDNEQLAHLYLDSSMAKIKKDKPLNATFLQPNYDEYLKYSVYHYKAILHGYNLEIDSALHYYDLMRKSDYFSDNNFGNLHVVRGNFALGFKHYQLAQKQYFGEKQLQEWAYYSAMLSMYKSEIPYAVTSLKEMLKKVGSTPGFGWYNIALARSLNYGGNVSAAKHYYNKAENFKEVHIGTTLGEPHYNIALAMVKYHQLSNELHWLKFSDKNWWYKPMKVLKVMRVWLKKVIHKYKIINLLKSYPEREQVIYKLFATESTVSWDEVLMSMENMSNNYFLKYYKSLEETDKRSLLKVYFQFAQAKILVSQSKYDEALKLIEDIESRIDESEYDALLKARCCILKYQILNENASQNIAGIQSNTQQLYDLYPQLIPFSGIKVGINLRIDNSIEPKLQKSLNQYNIDWNNHDDSALVQVHITKNEEGLMVSIAHHSNEDSREINISWDFKDKEDVIAQKIVEEIFHIYQINE
jgi:hypothetical protein